MIRIDPVWDSTTAVLARRAPPIALIAFGAFLLPPVLQQAAALGLGERSVAGALAGAVLALLSALAAIWGSLAVMALAADPPASLGQAARAASARLLPVIGVVLVITVVAMLLFMPIVIALSASGADWRHMMANNGSVSLDLSFSPQTSAFVAIYALVLLILGLWVSARLLLTNAVVLFERRGLGAVGRSIALSRRSTWRLIAALVLFMIVFGVAVMATEFVVGAFAGVAMQGEHPKGVSFVADVAGAFITSAFLAVVYVFVARAYAFARAGEQGRG